MCSLVAGFPGPPGATGPIGSNGNLLICLFSNETILIYLKILLIIVVLNYSYVKEFKQIL